MPNAYIIATVDVTDPQQYEEYKKFSSLAIKAHDAEVEVRGGKMEVLEGDWAPARVVVIKFSSMAHARTFYDSTEYRAGRAARANAAVMRMILVEGV